MRELTEETLISGLEEVARRCPEVAGILTAVGFPTLRRRPAGFPTLLRVIVGQQVSVASADAIWRRVKNGIDPLTAENVLALDDSNMQALGLSRPKIRYARALAKSCATGSLDLDDLENLDDKRATQALVAVTGIGRWTAEVYLLFALGRRNALPADDLALLIAAQDMFRLPERPKPADLVEAARAWSPWRGAVAHLLWRAYSARRNRMADPV